MSAKSTFSVLELLNGLPWGICAAPSTNDWAKPRVGLPEMASATRTRARSVVLIMTTMVVQRLDPEREAAAGAGFPEDTLGRALWSNGKAPMSARVPSGSSGPFGSPASMQGERAVSV